MAEKVKIIMKLRFGIIVGLLMAFLSLYPQIYFQNHRGDNFNGATFYYDFDESAYASYLQALIDGRPRKNSIYQGSTEPQEKETLFSVQFFSAYLPAIPARFLGLSSDTTFLAISFVFAFLAGFTIFVFLSQVTENEWLAAVGTIFILIFGANAGGASILKEIFGYGASFFYLTFLRRFTPAVVFPFIFVLISCVWLGLKATKPKFIFGIFAAICFAFLIYGYFFYWTAMLVWLIFLAFLWILFQKENRQWTFWLIIFGGIFVLIIPYFLLLFDRNPTINTTYVLELTRNFDFLRPSLLIGLLVFALTIFSLKMKWVEIRSQTIIFSISFSLLPILVFNQQIVTGRSLQPMHYNMYILNYLVLLGLVLLISEVLKEKLSKLNPIIWIVTISLICVWGVIETNHTTKYRLGYNIKRDEGFLVSKRLAELSKDNFEQAKHQITFNLDSVQADNQPTVSPQGVLWAEHLFLGGNITFEEHERRYFLYIYFQNRDVKWLQSSLQNCPNEACRALIGWRVNPTLSFSADKIESNEINQLVEKYSKFIQDLTPQSVLNPSISYLIVPNGMTFDFSNFDKVYQKESSEQIGNFTLYKLKIK